MKRPSRKCSRCAVRIGWVGLFVDAILVGVKLAVGLKTGSRAMMADCLYSLIDVLSALLVIGSLRVSRRSVDEDHPYGQGKVEFLAIACVSLCIAAFAFLLLHRAGDTLLEGSHGAIEPLGAVTAILAAGACYMVWRYASCVGTRLNSPIILSHAEHNKADALSSLAVLVTIVLSWIGLGVLDPLVAIAEIVHVLAISVTLLRRGIDGLLDVSTGAGDLAKVAELARSSPGVLAVEDVRVRRLGSSLWIELAVRIEPQRSMADAGRIRAMIRAAILSRIEHVGNVMIEVRPAVMLAMPQLVQPKA